MIKIVIIEKMRKRSLPKIAKKRERITKTERKKCLKKKKQQ